MKITNFHFDYSMGHQLRLTIDGCMVHLILMQDNLWIIMEEKVRTYQVIRSINDPNFIERIPMAPQLEQYSGPATVKNIAQAIPKAQYIKALLLEHPIAVCIREKGLR